MNEQYKARGLLTACAIALLVASCTGGGGSSGGSSGGGSGGGGASPPPPPPQLVVGTGPFIVVDQFGYLPGAQKIAVIRDPIVGFDASNAFTPGATYQVVDWNTGQVVFTGSPAAWNAGATDASSGDRAWVFDFSAVTTPGSYRIRDVERNYTSELFDINSAIYQPVLVQAFRTFFYQRAGYTKRTGDADPAWADGASHIRAGQDIQAAIYSSPNDTSTWRSLRGGWYDAGESTRYTNGASDYAVGLLQAYIRKPSIWTDSFIHQGSDVGSKNGVPDILDEAMWGIQWLVEMQNSDGSVLSMLASSDASPPRSSTGPSYYGPQSTSATLSAAAAYAFASKVFSGVSGASGFATLAPELQTRAVNAWNWAQANPNVVFRNNDASNGSVGMGARQQEVDDYGRAMKAVIAAVYLFDLSGEAQYRDYVDAHYGQSHLLMNNSVSPEESDLQRALLYYGTLPGATGSVSNSIRLAFENGVANPSLWGAVTGHQDPYLAYLGDYAEGSNGAKARLGGIYADMVRFNLGGASSVERTNAAANYLHYLHGVNPLGKTYLSTMRLWGAENSVDQFFHFWFADGTQWDSFIEDGIGPAPGFLVGGPNQHYDWDPGCPGLGAACGSQRPTPPFGQPPQKSYMDFNPVGPLNSRTVTENSDRYQVEYLLLIENFVN